MTTQETAEPIANKRPRIDTGLICLVTIARMLGIAADIEQMRRAYVVGAPVLDTTMIMRAAKQLGLKTRLLEADIPKLLQLPMPAMIMLKNKNYLVAVRVEGPNVIIIDPYKPQPLSVPIKNLEEAWNGEVLLMARRLAVVEKEKKFGLSWFIPAIMRYKRFLGQVLFISLVIQLFGLISPLFTQVIIDNVLVHRSLTTLDIFILGMVVISIFQVWLTAVRSYLFSHTTNKIDITLSTKLFKHITALPIQYFDHWQVGDVVSRVRELDNVRQFITGSSLTVVLDTLFAVIYIAVMFTYNTSLSVVALLAVLLYIILNVTITPIFKRRLNKKFLTGTEMQAFLIESVTGIHTIKALGVEGQFIQKWEQLLSNYINSSFATANLANIASNIGNFIQQLFTMSILWVGAHIVLSQKMSVGELIAFQMLASQVIAPVLRLVNMWQYFQQTMVSVDRLSDILNEEAEPAFNPGRTTLPAIQGEIILDRVTFRYRQDTAEILRQINLKIRPGMRVGIVGKSGSGKSTLTKLIQRLYVPDSGRVLIDGVDLSVIEPAWLRRQVGVVLQENFLFNGSIKENIAAARPEASEEEIIQASHTAGCHEFIEKLQEGYQTIVGERGVLLSGGQRQRIAIARALLINPSILIFDEATSALDYESEKIIMENLDKIAAGRTMLLIAHRLSTVRRCDAIIVMEKGSIVEIGTHEVLLNKKGFYYQLHTLQATM